jgi:hypothetical protein
MVKARVALQHYKDLTYRKANPRESLFYPTHGIN